MNTFIQTSNTQRENENKILSSEKQNKLDALAETLKLLTIKDAGYSESDSASANDATSNQASDPKIATHTSDEKKRKSIDTSNRYLQQKLLRNQTLPIITTMIDPRIDDRVAPCGASLDKLATPQTMEVIMDAACSSVQQRSAAQLLCTPRRISRTIRYSTTPGDCYIAVSSPWGNSPFLIGCICVARTR